MEIGELKSLLKTRIYTKETAEDLANKIDVSVPTIYRYKENPEKIPYGLVLKMMEYFEIELRDVQNIFTKEQDFVLSEQRRYELEERICGGVRYVVTPVFSFNCEIEQLTRITYNQLHPHQEDDVERFIKIRGKRRKLYQEGGYTSYEIIDAGQYRDFYLGVNRYASIPQKIIDKQIEYLIESSSFSHVHRKIYFPNTPSLPTISCYEQKSDEFYRGLARADIFKLEYSDKKTYNELLSIFNKFYGKAEIYDMKEIVKFLQNPMKFPLF